MTLTLPIRLDHDSAPDDTRYITAEGLPVLVYNVNGAGSCPIHGAIFRRAGWELHSWCDNGKYSSGEAHPFDLRDRPKAKRGVWVAWWEPANGAPDYSTLHRTKGQALAKALRIECNLITLHYLEEGDGLDTPADPPLWVDWSRLPDWAKWAAADEGGCAWFYSEKPLPDAKIWGPGNTDKRCAPLAKHLYHLAPGFDWRNTLIQRPEDV